MKNPETLLSDCRHAAEAAPDSVAALQAFALALAGMQRWREAIVVNEKIAKLDPGNWQAIRRLGLSKSGAGDVYGAIAAYREALAIAAKAEIHNDLGAALMDAGDGEGAVTEIRRAIALNPHSATAYANLGIALRLTNRLREAREAIQQALAINPQDAEAHANLGNVLRDLGYRQEAIQSLEECVRLRPDMAAAHGFLAGAYLEAGQPGDALRAIDDALRLDPVNRTALAYKVAALQETGDLDSARFLLDFENMIDVRRFPDSSGIESLQGFNERLSAYVVAHPTLSYERAGIATRLGSQTANIFEGDKGPAAELEKMINAAVREYYRRRETIPQHPFMAHRLESWKCVAWAVVLHSQGHQIPHFHPSAWLSGVYYVKMPQVVRLNPETQDGWIEFGRPPDSLACRNQVLQKSFLPEEGTMILFPSYFYHRTIPFESDEERISIAFDVTPA